MPDAADRAPGTTDAAQAFEDLRAEVSVLRRTVEALPVAIIQNRAPDYAKDFALLGQGLGAITDKLDTIRKYPALRMTPEQQGQSIAQAGSAMLREAVQKLSHAADMAERERQSLASMIGTARTKQSQRSWLMGVGAAGLVVGFVLFPFMMRVMPFGIDSHLAAAVMGAGRWDAGIALMRAGDSDRWQRLVADIALVDANRERIAGCRAAAAKAKQEQSCMVAVSASPGK